MGDALEVVRVEEWKRYGWLRHGFSTRAGGVSRVYRGNSLNLDLNLDLNLGWTKEDEPGLVAENRSRFLRAVGGGMSGEAGLQTGWRMVTLRQVHSAVVRVVRLGDGALEGRLETAEGKAVLEGDGLMTDVPGVLVAVGTADCVPVLVVDVEKRVVAAFHAGWRGTVARIVERGIGTMVEEYGSRLEDLVAAVGPGIGACCYSVGEAVRAEFEAQFEYAGELFREAEERGRAGHEAHLSGDETAAKMGYPVLGESKVGPTLHLDLWGANRRQLVAAGLKEGQITVVGECTACAIWGGERKYFSHRREHGVAGRMLSVVGVVES